MELDVLHRAVAPEIVEFYGAFFIESCVYFCMELMDAGSMDKLQGAGVPEDVLAVIAGSMTRGLKFLKDDLQIIHRGTPVFPVTPSMRIQTSTNRCQTDERTREQERRRQTGRLWCVGAVGEIACENKHRMSELYGGMYLHTWCQLADIRYDTKPERIKGESQNNVGTYTVSSDVWSLGLSLIEIGLGRYPYPPETYENVFAQLTAIVHGPSPELPESYGETACDFVARW
jgi:mitogen-activated protein kinase kinase